MCLEPFDLVSSTSDTAQFDMEYRRFGSSAPDQRNDCAGHEVARGVCGACLDEDRERDPQIRGFVGCKRVCRVWTFKVDLKSLLPQDFDYVRSC